MFISNSVHMIKINIQRICETVNSHRFHTNKMETLIKLKFREDETLMGVDGWIYIAKYLKK